VLINRIKWFSKFDLKPGFHQVKMHPDSVKWTAFSCSEGLFEWKVIPFGLKNAPQIFQRKMDNIFGNYKEFMCTYIDDVLGNGKIRLQPHISQKILSFQDKMEDIKILRAFLGLLNYARNFIKDLGKYTTLLYNKTFLIGQRKFNTEDIKLVQKIKEMVNNLLYLSLPLDSDYLVIECDDCEQGWGAILKKKKNKYEKKS